MKPATPCPLWSVLHSSPKPYSFEPMKRIIFGLPRDTGTEVFLAFVYPIDSLTSAMPGGTAMRNTGQELYLLYITIPKYTVKSLPKCIHWKQMLHRLSVDSRSPIDRQSTDCRPTVDQLEWQKLETKQSAERRPLANDVIVLFRLSREYSRDLNSILFCNVFQKSPKTMLGMCFQCFSVTR